jgi:hypothetical protein
MTTQDVRRCMPAVAVAVALALAGCGGEEEAGPAPATDTPAERAPAEDAATPAAGDSQAYRDAVARVHAVTDAARSRYHHATAGNEAEFSARARDVASAAKAAARALEGLRPPPAAADLNRRMARDYRRTAADLEAELARSRPDLGRLGDVIRRHEKTGGDLYDQVLILP